MKNLNLFFFKIENKTEAAEAATEDEEDDTEIVDSIKNGNNVVAFFCK